MTAGTTTQPGRPRRSTPRLPRSYARTVGEPARRTMPAGRALVVIVVALLLGGLLNVTALTEAADRQPPSLKRDISQVLVWPFEQISGLLGLDQPRALLADRLGRDADAGTAGGTAAATVDAGESAPQEAGDALGAAAALAGREAIDTALGDAVAIPEAGASLEDQPTLTGRLEGPFTETEPLVVGVIGDSLTEQIGPTLIQRMGRPGVPGEAFHDFTYSSGLSRPDFYDWPARAAQLMAEEDPDIWVVMVGANDGQDVIDDGGQFRQLGTDEWEAIYRSRIGGLMDLLTADGRAVIWIGQPVMRDTEFDERMEYLSSLYQSEASARAYVSFVDARRVFAGDDGRYADYLPAGDGSLTQMRLGDGIHLTRSGAERLVSQLLPLLPIETG
ncbi:SGNH/GDSL hydrolase family protein [Euzebya pacifica]|uniref:SGNH/GDSL hydrolase family protein n=1 Tax=Euzebya pacifica TaxID=1608957 RepID=UPI0013E039CE|nr:DUF459 domain-containing protein [Euzebya pacifica]